MAALWGATFVLVQDAIRLLPPLAFLAYRFVVAAAVMAVVCACLGKSFTRHTWSDGSILGLVLALGYGLQTFALAHTTATNAGLITGLFVVLTPIMAAVVLGHRSRSLTWICAAASFLGLALLAGAGSHWHPLGDSLALGCALMFAIHILLTGAAVRRSSVTPLLAVQLGVCGFLSLLLAVALGELRVPHGNTVLGGLAATALLASCLGYWIQSSAQRYAGPSRTAVILATEPAFAVLAGVVVQGDHLTTVGWIGGCLMLIAVIAPSLLTAAD